LLIYTRVKLDSQSCCAAIIKKKSPPITIAIIMFIAVIIMPGSTIMTAKITRTTPLIVD
jgi:hypothetical protein